MNQTQTNQTQTNQTHAEKCMKRCREVLSLINDDLRIARDNVDAVNKSDRYRCFCALSRLGYDLEVAHLNSMYVQEPDGSLRFIQQQLEQAVQDADNEYKLLKRQFAAKTYTKDKLKRQFTKDDDSEYKRSKH